MFQFKNSNYKSTQSNTKYPQAILGKVTLSTNVTNPYEWINYQYKEKL
jgi:hypothetical protein